MEQVDQALQRAAYDIGYKGELIGVLEAEVAALREGRLADADVLRRAREAAVAPAEPAAPAPAKDSPVRDGAVKDSPVRDGAVQEGTVKEGALIEVSVEPAKDGDASKTDVAAAAKESEPVERR
jgi:hypothetical protein